MSSELGSSLSEETVRILQEGLLAWYRTHRRPLPWREQPTPYRVWVSELMLQQTRTETVLPYFAKWMEAFPDVAHLAQADLSDVLRVWEGLGYYARARYLHQGARIIQQEHGGRIPHDRAALLRLPGIGRYTAGAILSIAYGQDHPLVDGNVARVFSRLFAIEGVVSSSATQRRLWSLAERLLPAGQAGSFNQALMELGALLCTPRAPRCPECPVGDLCQARALGRQEELPVRSSRSVPSHDVAVGILRRRGQVYVQRRPPSGFLGGLWEFPGGKRRAKETLRECLARELQEELGYDGSIGTKLLTLRHAYSMYRVTLHAYECPLDSESLDPEAEEWQWANVEDLERLPFPAANRKLIAFLLQREHAETS